MQEFTETLFRKKHTWFPDKNPEGVNSLLEQVERRREAHLLALAIKLEFARYDERARNVVSILKDYAKKPYDTRQKLFEYPELLIWLKKSRRIKDFQSGEMTNCIQDFSDVYEGLRLWGKMRKIPRTPIRVTRYRVFPLLVEAIRHYSFPSQCERDIAENNELDEIIKTEYKLSEVLFTIQSIWPEAYRDICSFVNMVIHLPENPYRSSSSIRYCGVVIINPRNCSCLTLEESFVHEFGHQLLYYLDEVHPLTHSDRAVFPLPWSGNLRNFFGYFHAFYIYSLLVLYFEKRFIHQLPDNNVAVSRQREIVVGLKKSLVFFDKKMHLFTEYGAHLFEQVRDEVLKISK